MPVTVETFRILPDAMTIYVCILKFLYQSGPIDHSTINIICNSNLKKSGEWNKLHTNKTK